MRHLDAVDSPGRARGPRSTGRTRAYPACPGGRGSTRGRGCTTTASKSGRALRTGSGGRRLVGDARAQLGGPSGTPSAGDPRTTYAASSSSAQPNVSPWTNRRECGAQSRVRSPTAARRSGLPTGAARRRACHVTFIDRVARIAARADGPAPSRGYRSPERGDGPRHGVGRAWRASRARRAGTAGRCSCSAWSSPARSALYTLLALAVDVPRVHPDEERYLIGGLLARRGRGPQPPRRGLRLRPAPRRSCSPRSSASRERRRGLRLVQGRERAPLRADGRAGVPPRAAAPRGLVGGARGGAVRRDPVLRLGRDRDDRKPLVPRGRLGALYAIAMSRWSGRRSSASSRCSRRSAPRSSRAAARRPVRRWLGALACLWLIAPGDPGRSVRRFWPTVPLAARCAACFVARLASGASRTSLGAYWSLWRGYDPLPGREVVVYHLGDFAVYLAIVPLAVAPIVLCDARGWASGIAPGGCVRRAVRPPTSSACWSSRRSRARPGATTDSTTATASTSSRCG